MSERATINTETAEQRFISATDHLRMADETLRREWSPDAPPLTIVFSNYGRSLCKYASSSTDAELIETCATIEDLLIQGDEKVKDAVATGMLEVILAESSAGRFDIASLLRFLGPETKAYCRSWDAFTGNKTQGISA